MFSVLVLTLNEERALPACLASLRGCDDVVVLDSGSTDGTQAVARAAGARVFTHPFESFAAQRTHAQTNLSLRHPWVFHLDADERFTPELHAECASWPADAPFDGAYVAPRMLLHGRWVRRSSDFPAYQARFVHRDRFRWIQVGHGQREAPGQRLATLRASYEHDVLIHGEAAWLEKHRRYAREEAARHLATVTEAGPTVRALVSGDPLLRRRALKQLSYHLPARPFLRWSYQYLLRGGFLDGRAGWQMCRLLAQYERFAVDALRAARRSNRGPE
ncbi:MAG TPA: glycosyltransferase family 2 protein [Opitutaceae bacterium]|jgi:glycosyltransferase involved in cell wall biosynthesis|nr:glycosyltransferase family 2 protein [Opitutaceae bacterium]HRE06350.1 glycosyltransferase family 2 protein [Opitutaceae bacterium]